MNSLLAILNSQQHAQLDDMARMAYSVDFDFLLDEAPDFAADILFILFGHMVDDRF